MHTYITLGGRLLPETLILLMLLIPFSYEDKRLAHFFDTRCSIRLRRSHEVPDTLRHWGSTLQSLAVVWSIAKFGSLNLSDSLRTSKLSRQVTSHPDQLSLAITPWVGAFSTVDDRSYPQYGLLVASRSSNQNSPSLKTWSVSQRCHSLKQILFLSSLVFTSWRKVE